ncbi:MAG: nucleotidyltransferase family protein [Acidobacteriota bacterium]
MDEPAQDVGRIDATLWAKALDGDPAALRRCAARDVDGGAARRERVAAALAVEARAAGVEGPAVDAWRSRLREVAVHQLLLEEALSQTGAVLGDAGVRWAPLKGLDLGPRVYPRPEARPTSDVDVLVSGRDLDVARRALVEAGWSPWVSGALAARYLREEGYAWQSRSPGGALVELHFRLWGAMAPDAGDVMIEDAAEDPALGPGGVRLGLADAYVLVAFHLFLDAPPRRIGSVRDLVMLSRAASDDAAFVDAVCRRAERLDVQLPTALAARWSAALWAHPSCAEVERRLLPSLRRFEARWARGLKDPRLASYPRLTLARHLDRRTTRHGLARLAWRRLWAHPGIVDMAYDGDPRPFPVKRALYQLRDWGLQRAPKKGAG